jgi:DNA-binding NarL/FixJ family response regulator
LSAQSATPPTAGSERKLAILIVDDHEIVHWGLRVVLSRQTWVSRCIGARTAEDALALTRRYEPHVAIVDLMLGDETGADVCEQIRDVSPRTRVLLISGTGRIGVRAAASLGASGFISKDRPAAELVQAILTVGRGGSTFARAPEQGVSDLSPRERDVLALVAQGSTNREIASAVHLSPHTVKEHLSSLYRKLGARNRTDALQRAQRRGLIA